ncbi:unnamed protein product [Pleuronectes platessa]|uniref:Uncharacterized protein n=1 Tax=Pleuronectes platessa TaxID=8262 RepID=A0A9N7Z7Q7_PLEPL|nr:unnamed protein product [Pleuronectes platessa]
MNVNDGHPSAFSGCTRRLRRSCLSDANSLVPVSSRCSVPGSDNKSSVNEALVPCGLAAHKARVRRFHKEELQPHVLLHPEKKTNIPETNADREKPFREQEEEERRDEETKRGRSITEEEWKSSVWMMMEKGKGIGE